MPNPSPRKACWTSSAIVAETWGRLSYMRPSVTGPQREGVPGGSWWGLVLVKASPSVEAVMPSHFGGESMLGRLLLLFIVVPLVELYLLIEVGSRLGAGTTVILIALTGGVGALLARMQGFRVVLQIRERLRGGQLPADELLSGGLVVAGGLLLVTPGLLTDAVGLALLLPFVRSRVVEWVKGFIQRKIQEGSIDVVAWEGDE